MKLMKSCCYYLTSIDNVLGKKLGNLNQFFFLSQQIIKHIITVIYLNKTTYFQLGVLLNPN